MAYPDLNTATDSQLRAFCARVDRNGIWYASDEPDGTDAPRDYMVSVIREWAQDDGVTL
jgi:hypothetical protein